MKVPTRRLVLGFGSGAEDLSRTAPLRWEQPGNPPRIKPTSPEFCDGASNAIVAIGWQVRGRDFLLCNLRWLGILGGGLVLLLIALGFIRPTIRYR